mmetsp:Transcript_37896/g.97825  ORF Transcript_37896/g.97825 Transcript_37896/m.97825 type:complete len:297 (+) Transcript_37896:247-1137(+)
MTIYTNRKIRACLFDRKNWLIINSMRSIGFSCFSLSFSCALLKAWKGFILWLYSCPYLSSTSRVLSAWPFGRYPSKNFTFSYSRRLSDCSSSILLVNFDCFCLSPRSSSSISSTLCLNRSRWWQIIFNIDTSPFSPSRFCPSPSSSSSTPSMPSRSSSSPDAWRLAATSSTSFSSCSISSAFFSTSRCSASIFSFSSSFSLSSLDEASLAFATAASRVRFFSARRLSSDCSVKAATSPPLLAPSYSLKCNAFNERNSSHTRSYSSFAGRFANSDFTFSTSTERACVLCIALCTASA